MTTIGLSRAKPPPASRGCFRSRGSALLELAARKDRRKRGEPFLPVINHHGGHHLAHGLGDRGERAWRDIAIRVSTSGGGSDGCGSGSVLRSHIVSLPA